MTVQTQILKQPAEPIEETASSSLVNTRPSLNRELFRLAWPSLIENILQTMLGIVDLVFVGKLGADAIAGVGLGNQWMLLLQVLFMGLAVGNTALVARAMGAKDKPEAERIAKQSLMLAVIFSMVIAIVGFFFSTPIVRLTGAEDKVAAIGGNFLRIISTFSAGLAIMVIGGGTLRGAGDMRTPMVITGIVNIINIVLAYSFVFGKLGFPRLGAVGSAVATASARMVGAVLILYVLFKRGSVLKLNLHGDWGFHRHETKRIMNIGGPSAAEQLVMQFGLLIFSMLAVSLGTNDFAAQQVAFNISSFSYMPAFAFGIAALTLVGQSLGARNVERAEQSAWQALKSGMVWMVSMGIGFLIMRSSLVGIYTNDPEVIRLGNMCMIFTALAQPLQAISIVLGQSLRGAGDTKATFVFTFLGVWIVRVGIGYLLGIVLHLGLFGMWLGWIGDFIVRAILVFLRFRAGRWKALKV